MGIMELLKDSAYIASLLRECNLSEGKAPFREEWIRDDLSDFVTNAFARLLPTEMPYLTRVVVERNPDTLFDGACVDDNDKRMRYAVTYFEPQF